MEIDEIVDYATKSPENTNPAVLRSMLSQLNSGSGGGLDSAFIVHMSSDGNKYITDKTLSETLAAGKPIVIIDDSSGLWSVGTPFDDDTSISTSKVTCYISGQSVTLTCQTLDWDESGITVNGTDKTIS